MDSTSPPADRTVGTEHGLHTQSTPTLVEKLFAVSSTSIGTRPTALASTKTRG